MRRKIDDFRKMTIPELHDEILEIAIGDAIGMLSVGLRKEQKAAEKAWDEKMVEFSKIPPPTFAHELYDYMSNEHGLILLESELDEIVRIVKNMKQ